MTEALIVADYDTADIHITYEDARHRYTLNGQHVPSITTILGGTLPKPALVWWAANITRDGCHELIRKHRTTQWLRRKWGAQYQAHLTAIRDNAPEAKQLDRKDVRAARATIRPSDMLHHEPIEGYRLPRNPQQLRADLTEFGLAHNQQRDSAAARGTDVHKVLEDWADTGKLPNASEWPESRRPYIRGLVKFLIDWQPQFIESEQIVGSKIHGFAGRRDSVVTIDLASIPDKMLGQMPAGVQGGDRILLDLKTSKGIYPGSHFRQLAAYELAARECGIQPTCVQGILRVGDGEYEIGWSDATPDDFLHVLAVWRDNERWVNRGRS